MKKKTSLKIVVIMLPICLMYFFYLNNKADHNLNQIINEYPRLTLGLELKGVVQQKIIGGELLNNSVIRVELNNKKFLMSGIVKNINYGLPYFDNFLQVGDSISKQINNDTIRVYRDHKEYSFVLEQTGN